MLYSSAYPLLLKPRLPNAGSDSCQLSLLRYSITRVGVATDRDGSRLNGVAEGSVAGILPVWVGC